MDDKVIDIKPNEVSGEQKQILEIKEQMKKAIDESESIILFAFKDEEEQGRKVPKSLIKNNLGFAHVGNPNFFYAEDKCLKVVKDIEQSERHIKAELSD